MAPGRRAFAFVWVTVLLDMMGIGLIIPVVPALLRELTGRDAAGASIYGGWLFFSYAAMQFLAAPLVGGLSDAIGRRPVLLLSVLGLGLDHALTAFSPTITWLFVGRLVAGLFGASFATANAYIADVTPPDERGKAFGMLGAAFGVGFILGPAIGGLLGDLGHRMPFFVAASLSLANFVYGLFVLPETHPKEKRTRLRLAQANPLGALFAIPGGPAVRALALALFLFFLGNTVYPAIWSFYTEQRYAWSPRTIGISLAVYGVVNTVVQAALVGPSIARWGERKAAVIGIVAGAIALLGTGFATESWMVFALVLVSAPAGIAMPAIQAIMSKQAPAEAQGRLQGVVSSLEGLSSIAGPLVMTQLFDGFGKTVPGMPFFAATVLCLVALAVLALPVAAAPSDAPKGGVEQAAP
jgi:DHA1 family tetracycline resistance protein-like MFS transporter